MDSEFLPFLYFIFFLLLLSPFSVSPHQPDDQTTPSPMNFLKTLAGARKGNRATGISQLKKYLANLGHSSPAQNQHDDFFDDSLEQAIKSYQTFFKLAVTGTLDPNTLAKLKKPRCGVPDKFIHDHHFTGGSSYFALFPGKPKWPANKRNLSYSFPQGTMKEAYPAIATALHQWASNTPLKFVEIPNYDEADIKISFEVREHGDNSPFDGPGGVLAHAFAPTDGRLHFDGEETWVNGVEQGKMDIETVGLHEMGHILGLAHSTDENSIMWPYISYGSRKKLNEDDIAGIKALYK